MGQAGQGLVGQSEEGVALALSREQADVTDVAAMEAALDENDPNVVVNAAVFHPVDLCETELGQSFAVNALAPGMLAAACERRDIRLIHLSTDYVFDGAQRIPYSENDSPGPLSVYARSKLAGEHVVLAASPRHCVVRTSSVYGHAAPGHGMPPFIERMLQRAMCEEPTRVVDDQVVSPTYAEDLGAALWTLAQSNKAGLFHMAGDTATSWYEVAERVFAFAGHLDLLSRTTTEEFGSVAPRPSYSALRSERWNELDIDPLPGIDDALERHLAIAHPELGS
jgi:dTDP-4-dehydrorhamnose reductase